MNRKDALQRIVYLAARLRDLYPDLGRQFAAVRTEILQIRRDQQSAYPPDPDYVAGVAEHHKHLTTACEELSRQFCEMAGLMQEHLPSAILVDPLTNAHNRELMDWEKSREELNRAIQLANAELHWLARQEAEQPAESHKPEESPETAAARLLAGKNVPDVLAVSSDETFSLDEKMRRVALIVPDAVWWKSSKWSDLLGVSEGRIRQTTTWKEWRNSERKR